METPLVCAADPSHGLSIRVGGPDFVTVRQVTVSPPAILVHGVMIKPEYRKVASWATSAIIVLAIMACALVVTLYSAELDRLGAESDDPRNPIFEFVMPWIAGAVVFCIIGGGGVSLIHRIFSDKNVTVTPFPVDRVNTITRTRTAEKDILIVTLLPNPYHPVKDYVHVQVAHSGQKKGDTAILDDLEQCLEQARYEARG